MNEITTKFKEGDTIFVLRAGRENVGRPCPVCFGQKYVVVILGNHEQVTTECRFCSSGINPPTGKEDWYVFHVDVREHIVDGITVERNQFKRGHTKVRYQFNATENTANQVNEEDCYRFRGDAEAQGVLLVAAEAAEQEGKLATKDKELKSYSWHVGYHRREAEKARRQVEYHTAKAPLMEAKAAQYGKGA